MSMTRSTEMSNQAKSEMPADPTASWQANAQPWIKAVRSGAIESRRLVTDRAIVEAVAVRRPQRVLDVGCGEGWLVRALSACGIECAGLDGSMKLIEAARIAGGGEFYVCSYADMAAGKAPVDGLFSVVVFNFALLDQDIGPLIKAAGNLIAIGGALIIQTVHPLSAGGDYVDGWRTEDFAGFPGSWAAMPWYFRTLESWVDTLGKCGFRIVEVQEPRHPQTALPLSLLITLQDGQT